MKFPAEVSEHEIRLRKVEDLRKKGIEPWPELIPISATCNDVVKQFSDDESAEYTIAGRVVSLRIHGKTIFCHIQDRTGKVQIYLKSEKIGNEAFDLFKDYVDIGDIIWCKGTAFTTKTGEITLGVTRWSFLAKCLFPLPEKFHGLTDIELKYRQRYLDLIANDETRVRFITRTKIIKALRAYLEEREFLEVETPMLHAIPGGAIARPFVTHHNALHTDLFLRIAPELFLKRLVIGGFERVYEINRNFRNEGLSTRHNPEFTMLEMYWAYQDYHAMMDLVEDLIRGLVRSVSPTLHLAFGEHVIDFEKPFIRKSMRQLLLDYGVSEAELQSKVLDTTLHTYGIKNTFKKDGEKIAALFEELVEKNLIQPTFVIDFPIDISPLSRKDPQDPESAARFELYIAAMEISNAFNELNEPFDQAQRFKEQAASHKDDNEAMRYDADYVHALEYGLPPTVGCGIGIDRLVMLLTNTTSIKEVILFPTLKKKE